MEKFYIYLHKTADTLETFYVGKGKDNRAWSTRGRSKFWSRVKDRHGYIVEIVSTGLSEQEAFLKEKELIKFYGRRDKNQGNLVNPPSIINLQLQYLHVIIIPSNKNNSCSKPFWFTLGGLLFD